MTSLWLRSYALYRVNIMLDLIYILVAVLFFAGCVAFTKACDKL